MFAAGLLDFAAAGYELSRSGYKLFSVYLCYAIAAILLSFVREG
jgi:hypothetical protein